MSHRASPDFWACYRALPVTIRGLADKAFDQLKRDPQHPSVHFKKVGRFWSARSPRSLGASWRESSEPKGRVPYIGKAMPIPKEETTVPPKETGNKRCA